MVALHHRAAVRRRGGRGGRRAVLGAGGDLLAAGQAAARARHRRRGHQGVRVRRDEPDGVRAGHDGAAPRRRQPRRVPRRARGPGHAVDRDVRLGGAEGALAAGHGPDGQAGGLRADRAKPRLGLGRPGNLGPPGRRGLGAERPQAVDRPGHRRRPDRRLGPQRRRRPGQRVRRGAGVAGIRGEGHRGEGVAALGVAGRHHPGRGAGAGREPAARGALVQGHHPGPGHHPEHLRLGGAGPRHRRLRRRPAVRAGTPAVRRAAGQLPDHPAAPGVHARGPDRDAAVLPADRPPGRGRR